MTIDQLMQMLPADRSKVRLVPRKRGPYRKKVWTESELIEQMQRGSLKTTGMVSKAHAGDRNAPTVYNYVKIFGRFSAATEKAFGKAPAFPPPPPSDPDYIVKCCEMCRIETQRQYYAARRSSPGVVPSSRQVRKVWGSFGNLFFACTRQYARRTFNSYLAMERRLGRIPTALECRQAGLDLSPLQKLLGMKNKWGIDDLLKYRNKAKGIAGKADVFSDK